MKARMRRTAVLLVGAMPWMLALAALPATAQNLFPNPEFNTGVSPWVSYYPNATGDWNALDSSGCAPDSGSLELECWGESAIEIPGCIQYSGDSIYVSYDVRASVDLQGQPRVYAFMYSDTNCQTPAGPIGSVGSSSYSGLSTAFSRRDFILNLHPDTQSVRVRLYVTYSNGWCNNPGNFVSFDSLYLGARERIAFQDFESGDSCPLTAAP